MPKRTTLILDGKTINKLITMRDAVREIEKGFKYFGQGKVQMPPKVYINVKEHKGDLRAMPVYCEGFNSCGIKWVNVHPDNKKRGLPTVMGIMIVSDPVTGYPISIMDATCTTAYRTGAAGGVAAKYLARKDSRGVALVGCGVQARTQLEAILEFFKVDHVKVWGLRPSECIKFKKDMRKKISGEIEIVDTVRGCVKDADIIVTTTPTRTPIIKSEWIKAGAHINAIGADAAGKQELQTKLLTRSKIVVDAWEQASHSGEINVPVARGKLKKRDIYADIGQIVSGKRKGRQNSKEITVFDSTGLAVQDIAISNLIYRKAKKQKKGKRMELI